MEYKKCIKCNSEDLNTSMSITLYGTTHTVHLCSTHSEDTTPAMAKDLLKAKLEKMDEIIDSAKEFGMTVISNAEYNDLKARKAAAMEAKSKPAGTGSKILLPPATKQQPMKGVVADATSKRFSAKKYDEEDLASVVSTPKERATINSAMLSGTQSGHQTKRTKDAIVRKRQVKTQSGRILNEVAQIEDGMGTTDIIINPSVTDEVLKKRTKWAKEMGDHGESGFNLGSSQFAHRDCRKCSGKGILGANACHFCEGTGIHNYLEE